MPSQGEADAGSVDNRTLATTHTHKRDKEKRKKQSTGNALYRLALEEEERRSRRQKVGCVRIGVDFDMVCRYGWRLPRLVPSRRRLERTFAVCGRHVPVLPLPIPLYQAPY